MIVMHLKKEFPVYGFIGLITGKPIARSCVWQSDFVKLDSIWMQLEMKVMEYSRLPLLRGLNDLVIEATFCKELPESQNVSIPCIILSEILPSPCVGQKNFKQGELQSTRIRFYNQGPDLENLQKLLETAGLDIKKVLELVKKSDITSTNKQFSAYWRMALKRLF